MRPTLGGVFGAVGRLVVPADVVSGRLTTLLGVLWLSGGAWILMGWLLGLYDQGWQTGIIGVAAMSVALGAVLLMMRARRLGTLLDVTFTLLGSLAIALVALWAGPRGVGVTGMLYVYVTCFAAIALRRQAVAIALVSAGMHLGVLLAADDDGSVAIWVVTWGTAMVAGLVIGAAVEWLRQLVGHLEEADGHRTRFVATVSHELRTPLTAVLGFSETLQRDWDRLDESERRRFLDIIDRQARRQLRLVEDVLTMSTLMRGAIVPKPERVDVNRLLAEVAEALPFPVELDIAQPLTALVDPAHLERILDNLLINADRYGHPPFIVRARAAQHEVHIDVVDHGEGIPGGTDAQLFEPFVQGDTGDRRRSAGVGLGLTLCRDLVACNHGRLDYEQTRGGGATIRLALPAG